MKYKSSIKNSRSHPITTNVYLILKTKLPCFLRKFKDWTQLSKRKIIKSELWEDRSRIINRIWDYLLLRTKSWMENLGTWEWDLMKQGKNQNHSDKEFKNYWLRRILLKMMSGHINKILDYLLDKYLRSQMSSKWFMVKMSNCKGNLKNQQMSIEESLNLSKELELCLMRFKD